MARPKKPEAEKRSKVVSLRLSLAEYTELEAKAMSLGTSVGRLCLSAALGRQLKPNRLTAEMLVELRRQGNNLNQIAKRYHESAPDSEKERFLRAFIVEMRALAQKILKD